MPSLYFAIQDDQIDKNGSIELIQTDQKKKQKQKKEYRDRADYYTKKKEPKPWIYEASRGWMGQLPDETFLKDISIPGTHDSGANFGSWVDAQTQSWNITSQLKSGVRYLDIRCRRDGTVFDIQHGLVFQKLVFDDVMDEIIAFLKEQPTETVIMRLKNEFVAKKNSNSFQEIWDTYVKKYSGYFFQGDNSNPTLGQVRGKVFLMCNADCSGYGMMYEENSEIQDRYKITSLDTMFRLRKDKASISSKEDSIMKFIEIADTSSKWVLNHLSGAEGMSPTQVARITNSLAYSYLGLRSDKRKVGIIIMDFPGEKLIRRIFDTNFSPDCSCPEITFRNESKKSWVEFRLPKRSGNSLIYIESGAYSNSLVFPICYRVKWTDLIFKCNSITCKWEKISGSWDTDSWCISKKSDSKYVYTGVKTEE